MKESARPHTLPPKVERQAIGRALNAPTCPIKSSYDRLENPRQFITDFIVHAPLRSANVLFASVVKRPFNQSQTKVRRN
jgi:hypothetical protein